MTKISSYACHISLNFTWLQFPYTHTYTQPYSSPCSSSLLYPPMRLDHAHTVQFIISAFHRKNGSNSLTYSTPDRNLKAEVNEGTASSYESLSVPKGVNRYSNLCFDSEYVDLQTPGDSTNYETVGET